MTNEYAREGNMKNSQILVEIRETNLTYLMLAQHMLRADRETAMFRLGISTDVAGVIESLTPAQVSRIAASSTLVCRLRCDDRSLLDVLAGYGTRAAAMAGPHGAILMAGQPAATIA